VIVPSGLLAAAVRDVLVPLSFDTFFILVGPVTTLQASKVLPLV
jgi:hypothetical protein